MASKIAFTTLRQLIDSFSARGAAPAIVAFTLHDVETIPYEQLSRKIRCAAAALRDKGIGAGDRVLLWAPNSPAWIIAYFAIVETGATAIPCDDQYTSKQVASILRHCSAKLVVTTTSHLTAAHNENAARNTDHLLLDSPAIEPKSWQGLYRIGDAQSTSQLANIKEDQVASLLYTSGTTGTPKAVPLTHRNLTSNLSALLTANLIGSDDRALIPLPFHHTYPFTVGLLTVLGSGGTVIIPSGVSGPELVRAMKQAQATVLLAVPRLCAALWDAIEARVKARGKWSTRAFSVLLGISIVARRITRLQLGKVLFRQLHTAIGPKLRMLGCGGAQLDSALAWNLEGLGWTVLTGYGLTETSPVLTFNRWNKRRLGSEGLPLPNVELRIVPEAGTAHGEILARGPNVFSGYWNSPDETRAAFTSDGWFRTGDLGWLDAKGFLYIAGRNKEVIVLADGKNIFPDQIETAYSASPILQEVAVLEQQGALVALIVPDEQALRERGSLRVSQLLEEEIEEISSHLPRYQRLTDYRVTRRTLPRTALGKLKRHQLATLYSEDATRQRAPTSVTLSDEDSRLIESRVVRDVWQWLKSRYPDHVVTLDSSPQLDLQFDSLEWVSFTLELEQRFTVSLTAEAVSAIVTVRELLFAIEDALAAGPGVATREQAQPPSVATANIVSRALGRLLLTVNRLLMKFVFRLKVAGLTNLPDSSVPIVVTPNHASYLDALAVAAALPKNRLPNTYWAGWVGKMYAGPISRLLSRATNVFPIDPDRDFHSAVQMGLAVLNRQQSLVWFPEGRRSRTGALQRFRSGIGSLLASSPSIVIPTAIHGTVEAWPRQRRFPRPRAVTVIFGAPLDVEELLAQGVGDGEADRIADGLRQQVARLLDQFDDAANNSSVHPD